MDTYFSVLKRNEHGKIIQSLFKQLKHDDGNSRRINSDKLTQVFLSTIRRRELKRFVSQEKEERNQCSIRNKINNSKKLLNDKWKNNKNSDYLNVVNTTKSKKSNFNFIQNNNLMNITTTKNSHTKEFPDLLNKSNGDLTNLQIKYGFGSKKPKLQIYLNSIINKKFSNVHTFNFNLLKKKSKNESKNISNAHRFSMQMHNQLYSNNYLNELSPKFANSPLQKNAKLFFSNLDKIDQQNLTNINQSISKNSSNKNVNPSVFGKNISFDASIFPYKQNNKLHQIVKVKKSIKNMIMSCKRRINSKHLSFDYIIDDIDKSLHDKFQNYLKQALFNSNDQFIKRRYKLSAMNK